MVMEEKILVEQGMETIQELVMGLEQVLVMELRADQAEPVGT